MRHGNRLKPELRHGNGLIHVVDSAPAMSFISVKKSTMSASVIATCECTGFDFDTLHMVENNSYSQENDDFSFIRKTAVEAISAGTCVHPSSTKECTLYVNGNALMVGMRASEVARLVFGNDVVDSLIEKGTALRNENPKTETD